MAKHIMVPCKTCPEEEGADHAPQRKIVKGKLIKEDDAEAEFELGLSCGHTVEFTFTQEEKPDILERLEEADKEQAEQAAIRAAQARAKGLREQALEEGGGEDPHYTHDYNTGDITKEGPTNGG